MGDFGETVINCINNSDLKDIKVKTFGYKDLFVEHGKVDELEKKYKLDGESIIKFVNKKLFNNS